MVDSYLRELRRYDDKFDPREYRHLRTERDARGYFYGIILVLFDQTVMDGWLEEIAVRQDMMIIRLKKPSPGFSPNSNYAGVF